jgi:tetratricopeptide (TPR) repeat protein
MTRDKDNTATTEKRRAAAALFERAGQASAAGSHAYAARLLRECCQLDPGNLVFRQALRRAAKARYRNNGRGSWLGWLMCWPSWLALRRAQAAGRHAQALELAEAVLSWIPWNVAAQSELARSAEEMGLTDVAIWSLEQARQGALDDLVLARRLARLYEKRGNFSQAQALWDQVAQSAPGDLEAAAKLARPTAEGPPPSWPEMATAQVDPVERVAAALRKAVEADPTSPAAHLALASAYRQAGRHEQAYQALAAGLGPTGQAFELLEEMASLAAEPLRRDLAITLDKLAEKPGDPDLREIQAALEREVLTQEVDLWRLRADRFPGRLGYRLELGSRLLRMGQVEEAIKELTLASGDEPSRWKALGELGQCWLAWQSPARALRFFEEALAAAPPDDPGRLELLYHAACCHAAAGSAERALERGAELAEAAPGYRDILPLLASWQSRARPAS